MAAILKPAFNHLQDVKKKQRTPCEASSTLAGYNRYAAKITILSNTLGPSIWRSGSRTKSHSIS